MPSRRFPRRAVDRLHRYDDHERGYENAVLYVMNADGSNRRALTTSPRPYRGGARLGGRRPLDLSSNMTIMARREWRGSGSTAAIRTVAEGLSGADFDRPYTGGSYSVSRDGTVVLAGGSATRPPTSCSCARARGGN